MPEANSSETVACLDNPAPALKERKSSWPWRKEFIRHLRSTGHVTNSARKAGVSLARAYEVRDRVPRFAEAWRKALLEAKRHKIDIAEGEAFHRAVYGRTEPVFQMGKVVGHKRKRSDALLVRVLEAERPRKWSSRRESHSGGTTVVVNVQNQQRALMDPEVADAICRLDALMTAPRALEAPTGDPQPGTTDLPS